MKLRSAKDASSLGAQCWISSVTGFLNLQGAEIQKTGLKSSECPGSWKGPDRLALMFIVHVHCFMPVGRLSSGTLSFIPYPSHSKKPPSIETSKCVSLITSTPRMESIPSVKSRLNNTVLYSTTKKWNVPSIDWSRVKKVTSLLGTGCCKRKECELWV